MSLRLSGIVEPLGVFGVLAGQREMDERRGKLRSLVDRVAAGERALIGGYLRSGTVVLAIMEHTRDVLDDRFGVPGGSAILTDGVYYWRRDAAEYVDQYGIELPSEFLQLGRSRDWSVPSLSHEHVLAIDEYLTEHIRRNTGGHA